METVRRVRTELPASVALIGFAGAPWTVASYMVEGGTSRDFTRTKRWAFGEPRGFAALIDKLVEATIDYLSAQIEAGAEVLQLFDSWAGVLPDPAFERWVIAPTRTIVAALKRDAPGRPDHRLSPRRRAALPELCARDRCRCGEPRSDGAARLGAPASAGDAAGAGQSRSRAAGRGRRGDATAARAIRRHCRLGPFVFNLGHGILPETPPEHVSALVEDRRAARRRHEPHRGRPVQSRRSRHARRRCGRSCSICSTIPRSSACRSRCAGCWRG